MPYQITIVSIIFAVVNVTAAFQPGSPSSLHCEFRDSIYNQSRDSVKIYSLYNNTLNSYSSIVPQLHKLYWMARAHFLLGWYYYHTTGNKKSAKKQWKIMLKYTEEALKIEEFSEGYRLRAEAISHLCMVTSVSWVLINGLRIKGNCEKALELNPNNAKAMFLLGASKTYPPSWFGGNTNKAIKILHKALKLQYQELNDTYNIYTAMGVAFLKEKKYRKALRWLEKSVEIYPKNEFSNAMILKAKKKNIIDLQKYYPPEEEDD